jgi:hypothetical protein
MATMPHDLLDFDEMQNLDEMTSRMVFSGRLDASTVQHRAGEVRHGNSRPK